MYGSLRLALLFILFPGFITIISIKAEALPFHQNCASMEQYFKARFRTNSSGDVVSFANFSSGTYYNNIYDNGEIGNTYGNLFNQMGYANRDDAQCIGGYITESGPQGTKICKGRLLYSRDGLPGVLQPGMRYTYNNCRWK